MDSDFVTGSPSRNHPSADQDTGHHGDHSHLPSGHSRAASMTASTSRNPTGYSYLTPTLPSTAESKPSDDDRDAWHEQNRAWLDAPGESSSASVSPQPSPVSSEKVDRDARYAAILEGQKRMNKRRPSTAPTSQLDSPDRPSLGTSPSPSMVRRKAPPPLSLYLGGSNRAVEGERTDALLPAQGDPESDGYGKESGGKLRSTASRSRILSYAQGQEAVASSNGITSQHERKDGNDTGAGDSKETGYAALGLGLPISINSSGKVDSTAAHGDQINQQDEEEGRKGGGSGTAPSSRRNSTHRLRRASSGLNSMSTSPGVDRSRLIGLGELATPRWTSALNDRGWGRNGDDEGDEGWEYELYGRYEEDPPPPLPESPLLTRTATSSVMDFERRHVSDGFQRPFQTSTSLPNIGTSKSTTSFEVPPLPTGLGSMDHLGLEDPTEENAESIEAVSDDSHEAATRATEQVPSRFRDATEEDDAKSVVEVPESGSGKSKHSGDVDRFMEGWDRRASMGPRQGSDARDQPTATNATASLITESDSTSSRLSHERSPRVRRSTGGSHAGILPSSSMTSFQSQAGSQPGTESTRSSHHHHHQSPSSIAHSILKSVHGLDFEGIDMDTIAAADGGAAEALRKLDGLGSSTSPRMSRGPSNSSGFGGASTSKRTTPAGSRANSPHASVRSIARETSGDEVPKQSRRRSRIKSTGSGRDGDLNLLEESAQRSVELKKLVLSPLASSANLPSSSSMSSSQSPRSPYQSTHASRRQSQGRPPSAGAEVSGTPSFHSSKRGSASSASIAPFPSVAGSRDSTSATSMSTSSVPTSTRSPGVRARRGSPASDVSSVHSMAEGTSTRNDKSVNDLSTLADAIQTIPPVPPLPKDYDIMKLSTGSLSSQAPASANEQGLDSSAADPGSVSRRESRVPSPPAGNTELEAVPSSPAQSRNARTPTKKWSFSNAFNLSRSPSFSFSRDSHSSSDSPNLVSPVKPAHRSQPSSSTMSAASTRTSASNERLSVSGAQNQSLHIQNRVLVSSHSTPSVRSLEANTEKFPTTKRSSPNLQTKNRIRTSSTSSSSTSLTASNRTPTVNTTSPGSRSRSSLLSPRRTPSGIPFFASRKPSISGPPPKSPPPPTLPVDAGQDEKSGRKSILGLNFLSRSANRRSGPPLSPANNAPLTSATKTPSLSSRTTRRSGVPTQQQATIESPRSGMAARASSLIGRKRGQTLPSSAAPPKPEPLLLPPMQISAIDPSVNERVNSMTASSMRKPSSVRKPSRTSILLNESSSNTTKDSDSRSALPTIAGSPSVQAALADASSFGTTTSLDLNDNSSSPEPGPKSITPTKIPRPVYRTARSSPRLSSKNSQGSFGRVSPGRASFGVITNSASKTSVSEIDSDTGSIAEPRKISTISGLPRLRTQNDQNSNNANMSRHSTSSVASKYASPTISSKAHASLSMDPRKVTRASTVQQEEPSKRTERQTRLSSRNTSVHSAAAVTSPPPKVSEEAQPSVINDNDASSQSQQLGSASNGELPSAKSTRSLASKLHIPSRISKSSTSPSITRQPLESESGRSTSSSSHATPVGDDEIKGDEEMGAYVKRQRAKKHAAGYSADEISAMFAFPSPIEPVSSLDPNTALKVYGRYLSKYEKEEIFSYNNVYFVGPECAKRPASRDVTTNNYGYDDERGDYLVVERDHLAYRYEVIGTLGKGSFGQVLQCRDHRTGEMLAVKIIRNKKRFHHQALVEVKVLENLRKWDPDDKHNVIKMIESFTFRGHLCIATELLSINLYELVKANSFAGFSPTLIRRFTVQILQSLSLLRHHRVVHCDLKPENVLLRHPAKSGVKVIDFGSSCFEHEKVYTYIQSRFYRSPEVILGMNYHMAIDMFSLGCILAELFTGYPLFPGENEQEQLACIMEVLGVPDKYLIDRSSRKKLFFDSTGAPRPVVNSKGKRRRPGAKTLAQVLKCDDELFVDFIAKCLVFDANLRMKPDAAMRHPWIAAGRQRIASPAVPSTRATSRVSLSNGAGASTTGNSSLISTPRRKMGSDAALVSPGAPYTAPAQRTRTTSTSLRIATKGHPSSGLPSSTTRLPVKNYS